jgi:hypothetical protein
MAIRRRSDITVKKLRSAITNGSAVLMAGVDHRSAKVRRLLDLIRAHENDLGGEGHVTESECRLIRRAAMITLQLELMDTKFAQLDKEVSDKALDTYGRMSNTLRRLLESLGLQRRSRDVTPSLSSILRGPPI